MATWQSLLELHQHNSTLSILFEKGQLSGCLFFSKQNAYIYIYKKEHYDNSKKEFLNEKVSHYRIPLGEMNQGQLRHIQERFMTSILKHQKEKEEWFNGHGIIV